MREDDAANPTFISFTFFVLLTNGIGMLNFLVGPSFMGVFSSPLTFAMSNLKRRFEISEDSSREKEKRERERSSGLRLLRACFYIIIFF
jgi:hypothetical protein